MTTNPSSPTGSNNSFQRGSLPAGRVDRRSVLALTAADVAAYRHVHLFAGIGGWPLALRLAGWPDDDPIWSCSLPCQPLSGAGQRRGHGDERHLWPAVHDLIAECRPAVLVGEQVASADGREWLAGVRADLEALGYAVGAADLCAASVGAPHRRQRLFWVADAGRQRRQQNAGSAPRHEAEDGRAGWNGSEPDGDHVAAGHGQGGMADTGHDDRSAWLARRGERSGSSVGTGLAGAGERSVEHADRTGREGDELLARSVGPGGEALDQPRPGTGLADADGDRAQRLTGDDGEASRSPPEARSDIGAALPQRGRGELADAENLKRERDRDEPEGDGGGPRSADGGELGDAVGAGLEGLAGNGDSGDKPGWLGPISRRSATEAGYDPRSPWADDEWIICADGKARRIKSGLRAVDVGVPGRVGRLRGFGNSIVPPLGAMFLTAFMQARGGN